MHELFVLNLWKEKENALKEYVPGIPLLSFDKAQKSNPRNSPGQHIYFQ